MIIRSIIVLSMLAVAPVYADENNKIPTLKTVKMKIGQSKIINGFRGACGERPTNVDMNRTRDTKLGTLSIGNWGMKKSRACKGWTPAVEIIFRANKSGRETIDVNGDKIRVTVK